MKKVKQILAIIAIVILAAMYLTSLVLAIVLPKYALNFLFASIAATVFIPIILWIFIAMYNWVVDNRKTLGEENKEAIRRASEEASKGQEVTGDREVSEEQES